MCQPVRCVQHSRNGPNRVNRSQFGHVESGKSAHCRGIGALWQLRIDRANAAFCVEFERNSEKDLLFAAAFEQARPGSPGSQGLGKVRETLHRAQTGIAGNDLLAGLATGHRVLLDCVGRCHLAGVLGFLTRLLAMCSMVRRPTALRHQQLRIRVLFHVTGLQDDGAPR